MSRSRDIFETRCLQAIGIKRYTLRPLEDYVNKQPVLPKSRLQILAEYPIEGLAEGWFFRQREVSAGVYLIEGSDCWGRKISQMGTDPEFLLSKCAANTKHLSSQTGRATFMWPIKLLIILLRNQLFLKPAAMPAVRAVKNRLTSTGFRVRRLMIFIGLAESCDLALMVVLPSDAELQPFLATNKPSEYEKFFRDRLASGLYPRAGARWVELEFHSHEAILKGGGYYLYFK